MAEEYPEHLFLQEKPTLAMLAIHSLEKTYASVITKEIDSTFAHTTKILSKMEEYGLVKFTVEGRIKYVELTDHGYDVVDKLKELIETIKVSFPDEEEKPDTHEHNPENVPERTDRNEMIQDNINHLRLKIEKIYKQSIENGADNEAIARKLGPFKREIKRIENMIESEQEMVNDVTIISLNDTRTRLDSLIQKSI